MAKRSPFLLYLRIILLAVLFLAFLLLTFSEAKRRERKSLSPPEKGRQLPKRSAELLSFFHLFIS